MFHTDRLTFALLLLVSVSARSADPESVAGWLKSPILDGNQVQSDVERFCEVRVPKLPSFDSRDAWDKYAADLRARMLDEVVFRGEAAAWRKAKVGVEWLDSIEGGPGYRIRKLRYEALPGMWIPALLYEPEKLEGRVPAVMNVNGHDRTNGKAAKYKQLRCINQAKRGMLALNVEWLGMGQLNEAGYSHYRMNQLNLCGTSGLAPFYLAMSRGLDVLLSLEQVDPDRVAVAGLSGGGWQTIFISALDTRVKLCNPVAGYSSFLTRIRNHSDLGDSEQTPCDMAAVGDYTHMTALLAPRAALLTYNIKDNCCFASAHALPPLLEAARPIYSLYDRSDRFAFHINEDPGDHNFALDNRQALYRMVGQHFFEGKNFDAKEIPSSEELKSKEELNVPLPEGNASFQSIASQLSRELPRDQALPSSREAAGEWREAGRKRLRDVVRIPMYVCKPSEEAAEELGDVRVVSVRYETSDLQDATGARIWTAPGVRMTPASPSETVLVIADEGRAATAEFVGKSLAEGKEVVAIDPFYFGESKIKSRDFLFALLVSAVGERPLGIQAAQVRAVVRALREANPKRKVSIAAFGPRTSMIALTASAISEDLVESVEVHQAYGSLKEVIEREQGANQAPELLCFGLLAEFDIVQLAALSAPRPVTFREPSERTRAALTPLASHYRQLGVDHQPLP